MASNFDQYEDVKINENEVPLSADDNQRIKLHNFAVNLSKDYANYFDIDTSKEGKLLDDSTEDILTHLEEFCGLLEMIRTDNNVCLEQSLVRLKEKSIVMEKIYEQIDKMQNFVEIVKQCVNQMDDEVTKAEQLFATNSVKKFFKSIINSSGNRLHHQQPQFEPPDIFKVEDYIKSNDQNEIIQEISHEPESNDS